MGDDPGRVTGRSKRSKEYAVFIRAQVCALFNGVAQLTEHPHWIKEPADVLAITGPLEAIVETLPKKTLKAVEGRIAPLMLTAGLIAIVVPDAVREWRIRRQGREDKAAGRGTYRESYGGRAYPAGNGRDATQGGAYADSPCVAPPPDLATDADRYGA